MGARPPLLGGSPISGVSASPLSPFSSLLQLEEGACARVEERQLLEVWALPCPPSGGPRTHCAVSPIAFFRQSSRPGAAVGREREDGGLLAVGSNVQKCLCTVQQRGVLSGVRGRGTTTGTSRSRWSWDGSYRAVA